MNIAIMAFSDRGEVLANKIEMGLRQGIGPETKPNKVDVFRSGRPFGAWEWTEKYFRDMDALIYVGAMGIAVRAIAPFVKSKAEDPAVVVIDERGKHAISVLSGHLGGANELTGIVADITGADPVITTATDVNGVFAVDDWARKQGLYLKEKRKIVKISGRLLAGETVKVKSRWPIDGEIPEGIEVADSITAGQEADVVIDMVEDHSSALHLVPRICALGIGCRRGTEKETIQEVVDEILKRTGLRKEAIAQVASIDLKKDEEGLVEFCRDNGWDFVTYSVEELMSVPGDFSSSEFVRQTTGADNVCERSAVCATGGRLILKKYSRDGVTLAIARKDPQLRWQ